MRPQTIQVGSSEVVIARGLPNPSLPRREGREAVAVLFQPGAAAVIGDLRARCPDVRWAQREIPDREYAKDLAQVIEVYRWLADNNVGRHDTVISVGGGAATDVGGFVAATWLRGVESVLVPTTLLGAVDAAIGGKTGVNVGVEPGYLKNVVGVFWEPRRVLIDIDTLDRLPPRLRIEGFAEVLKAGLIGDPAIVAAFGDRGVDTSLDEIVPAAIRVKAAVVEADPREAGKRAILNFGHTVGHAVEGLTGMPHGFAVSVGMVAAAAVSRARFGFASEWLSGLLFSLGLPVAAAGVSKEAALRWIRSDKKRAPDGIRMVLLASVGDPRLVTVTDEELSLALEAIGAE